MDNMSHCMFGSSTTATCRRRMNSPLIHHISTLPETSSDSIECHPSFSGNKIIWAQGSQSEEILFPIAFSSISLVNDKKMSSFFYSEIKFDWVAMRASSAKDDLVLTVWEIGSGKLWVGPQLYLMILSACETALKLFLCNMHYKLPI